MEGAVVEMTKLISLTALKLDPVGVGIKIVIAGVFGLLFLFLYRQNSEGSAWSEVTMAMARHQGDRAPLSPLLIRGAHWWSYVVLGVPSADRTYPYEWVILDSTPGGRVITSSPDGHFMLKCSYLVDLERQVSVARAVHRYLVARCQRS